MIENIKRQLLLFDNINNNIFNTIINSFIPEYSIPPEYRNEMKELKWSYKVKYQWKQFFQKYNSK